MGKDRDWVDYAHLGLSAAQAATLSQISGQMGGMAGELSNLKVAAETQARMLRDGQEAQAEKALQLNHMRKMVWMAEELLTKLESEQQTQANMQRRYVFSLHVEDTLKTAGVIPPHLFDDWADKDRVGVLAARITRFRDELSGAMNEEQRREADLCWKYITEDQDLSRLIESRTGLEKRQAELRSKLASLEEGGGR